MLLLQGLLPRLAELAKLGGRFFLAFLPAVLIISALFTGIYAVSCCSTVSALLSMLVICTAYPLLPLNCLHQASL